MKSAIILVVVLVFLAIAANSVFFIVDEREQVVVTQLGEPKRTIQTPGLNAKIPFIQRLHVFDDRLLASDADPAPIYTQDKKNLTVDNYARWRIVDPLQFLKSVQSVYRAQSRHIYDLVVFCRFFSFKTWKGDSSILIRGPLRISFRNSSISGEHCALA